ncbi:hypothetical protein BANRA_02741 [Acinetobacter baumannii]|nr:hypothetical protein BANRA_02741 [Acinetobacter baumannii]
MFLNYLRKSNVKIIKYFKYTDYSVLQFILLRVHLVNGLKFKLNNELMVVVGDLRACIFPKMRVFMPKK